MSFTRMGWFYLFLARLASGERWRKATPREKRYFGGVFLLIPIVFTLLLILQRSHSRILRIFDSGAVTLWFAFTAGVLAAFFGCIAWGKYVPVRISVALAILAWITLLFLLFGLGFWDFGKT